MEMVFLVLMIFSLIVVITIDALQKRHTFLVEGN